MGAIVPKTNEQTNKPSSCEHGNELSGSMKTGNVWASEMYKILRLQFMNPLYDILII